MKNTLCIAILALSGFTHLQAAPAAPALPSEAEKIRRAIDNICGDTWCEGDYSFRFSKVILDPKNHQTLVKFTMSQADAISLETPTAGNFEADINKQSFELVCKIKNYSTFAAVMKDDDSLNWDFYTSLTDCIQALESRLVRIHTPNGG